MCGAAETMSRVAFSRLNESAAVAKPCIDFTEAIASRLAPTLNFGRTPRVCSLKINCGSEPARDDGGQFTTNLPG
jgi:hypothetical protein